MTKGTAVGKRGSVGAAVVCAAVGLLASNPAWAYTPPPGDLDLTFGSFGNVTEGQTNSFAGSVYRQADGQIVFPLELNGSAALVRMSGAGQPDPTFGVQGVATEAVNRVVPNDGLDSAEHELSRAAVGYSGFTAVSQSTDGTYYAVGYADSSAMNADGVVAHVLANGALDPAFGEGGVVVFPMAVAGTSNWPNNCRVIPTGVAALPNGQGVVVSTPTYCPGVPPLREFDRLGQENQGFASAASANLAGSPGVFSFSFLRAPNGDLLVGTCPGLSSGAAAVLALRPSGAVDTTYGNGGCSQVLTPSTTLASGEGLSGEQLAPGPDGTVLVVANSASASWMGRLTAAGQPDPAFGNGTATLVPTPLSGTPSPLATGLAVGDTGASVLLGADSTSFASLAHSGLASVLPSGATDTTFGRSGVEIIPDAFNTGLEVQPSYRVVVSSTFEDSPYCAEGPLAVADPADASPYAIQPPVCTAQLIAYVDRNP